MVFGNHQKKIRSSSIQIRPMTENDAEEVSRLIIDNLTHVNILDYGNESITQMVHFYTPEWIEKFSRYGGMFVACYSNAILGTISLDKERIRNVFVRMDHHHSGIGKLLMGFIEAYAVKQGIKYLYLEANIAAIRFY